MADSHKLFIDFNQNISLKGDKKDILRKGRNEYRTLIRNKINDKSSDFSINFLGQGSYIMHTIIEPNNCEYDLDDGIYLISEVEKDSLPAPATVHSWVVEAIKEKSESYIDKNSCVRVIDDEEYHIDFPIYHKKIYSVEYLPSDIPLLAHKSKGWIESDPQEFKKWFNQKAKDNKQLRRIVKYLKAWADNRSGYMPSGLVMTILATNNIQYVENRDDESLFSTLKNIQNSLNSSFSCYRPTTDTTQDLLGEYKKTKKEYLLSSIESLISSAEQALSDDCALKDACKKWKKHLGNRFPCDNLDEDVNKTVSRESNQYPNPAIIKAPSAKSA